MENEDLTVERHEKFTDPEVRAVMDEYVAITRKTKMPLDMYLRFGALYHDLCSVFEKGV